MALYDEHLFETKDHPANERDAVVGDIVSQPDHAIDIGSRDCRFCLICDRAMDESGCSTRFWWGPQELRASHTIFPMRICKVRA